MRRNHLPEFLSLDQAVGLNEIKRQIRYRDVRLIISFISTSREHVAAKPVLRADPHAVSVPKSIKKDTVKS